MHTCRLAPTIGLVFGTHLPTSADWLLRRFKFRIGGIAPISPDDRVSVWYTPADERRFSVGIWRYRQLPTASRLVCIEHISIWAWLVLSQRSLLLILSIHWQCSAQVFKRAGCHLKRAHLARWTTIKGAPLARWTDHQKGKITAVNGIKRAQLVWWTEEKEHS